MPECLLVGGPMASSLWLESSTESTPRSSKKSLDSLQKPGIRPTLPIIVQMLTNPPATIEPSLFLLAPSLCAAAL
jgi:hypothetical protein